MSEWMILEPASGNISSLWKGTKYRPGLNRHGNASHIVVYNRYKQILEEEIISPLVTMAMRNMYQTPFGMVMKSTGLYRHLKVPHCFQHTSASENVASPLSTFPRFNADSSFRTVIALVPILGLTCGLSSHASDCDGIFPGCVDSVACRQETKGAREAQTGFHGPQSCRTFQDHLVSR